MPKTDTEKLAIALNTLAKLNKCTCFMRNRDHSQGGFIPHHAGDCATSIISDAMEAIEIHELPKS